MFGKKKIKNVKEQRVKQNEVKRRKKSQMDLEPKDLSTEINEIIEENQPSVGTRIFGDEETLSQDVKSLEEALLEFNILEIYDDICETDIKCQSYMELVDSISNQIKTGCIVDSTITGRITPHTLLVEFYRVCCIVLDEELDEKTDVAISEKEAYMARIESLNERIKELEQCTIDLDEVHQLHQDKEALEEKYETLKEKYESVIDENNELQSKVVDMENQVRSDISAEELETLKEELAAIKDKALYLEHTKAKLATEVKTLTEEVENQNSNCNELIEENNSLKEKISNLSKEERTTFSDADIEAKIKSLVDSLNKKDMELMGANNKILELNFELSKKKKELLMIPDSSDIIQGLNESIQRVNAENKSLVDETIDLMTKNRKLEDELASLKVEKNSLEVLVSGYKRRLKEPTEVVTEVEDVQVSNSSDRRFSKEEMINMFILGMEYRAVLPKFKVECRNAETNANTVLEHISEFNEMSEVSAKFAEIFSDCIMSE